jgi:PBP1b-binding outer membrane lipoprotein LpoB
MKIYIIAFIAIFLSGCAHFQSTDLQDASFQSTSREDSVTQQTDVKQVCKKMSRHKNVIKRCRPLTSHQ